MASSFATTSAACVSSLESGFASVVGPASATVSSAFVNSFCSGSGSGSGSVCGSVCGPSAAYTRCVPQRVEGMQIDVRLMSAAAIAACQSKRSAVSAPASSGGMVWRRAAAALPVLAAPSSVATLITVAGESGVPGERRAVLASSVCGTAGERP